MGLYAVFSVEELPEYYGEYLEPFEAPYYVVEESENEETGESEETYYVDGYIDTGVEVEPVWIDYGPALDAFAEIFMDAVTELVPVDTGFLRSSIHAESDGVYAVECYVDAEYAQYVEYGTWKQDAQPYFEPALQIALDEVAPIIEECKQAAKEEYDAMVALWQEEAEWLAEESLEELFGSSFGIMAIILILALFALIYLILQELFSIVDSSYYDDDLSYDSLAFMPDIEII